MARVRAYIDGFNLYFGLRAQHGRRLHWLDLQQLVTSLLKPGQHLDQVTYFTARVRDDPPAEARQSDYLDALTAHCAVLSIVNGRYQARRQRCRCCGAKWTLYEEKETDVSIATALVEDAALDRFDTALLVSADSDLSPAVRSVKRIDAAKRIIAAFPPKRRSGDLAAQADGAFTIGDAKLRHAQLPEKVQVDQGVVIERPAHWT